MTTYNVPQNLEFRGGGRLALSGNGSLVSTPGSQEHSQEYNLDGLKVIARYYNPGGDSLPFVDIKIPTGETYEVYLGVGRWQTRERVLQRRIHNVISVVIEDVVDEAIKVWVENGKRDTVKGFD